MLEHPAVSDEYKANVTAVKETLGLIALQENLEKACEELDRVVMKNHADPSSGRRDG